MTKNVPANNCHLKVRHKILGGMRVILCVPVHYCNVSFLHAFMAGVYISRNEIEITNNSHTIINIGDTLVCHTDKLDCCQNNQGHWYSNDDNVNSMVQHGEGTVIKTFDKIEFRRYCCQIPDIDNKITTVCTTSG